MFTVGRVLTEQAAKCITFQNQKMPRDVRAKTQTPERPSARSIA
jgi:hypothetical protein